MKFLKKLGVFLAVVLAIAAIFAVVVAMNWELFSAMPQQMEQMQEAEAARAESKEVQDLLDQASKYFDDENLIEFEINCIYPDTGEMATNTKENNALDREQELMRLRQTVTEKQQIINTDGEIYGDPIVYEKTEISRKTLKWPDMRDEHDSWGQYREIEGNVEGRYMYTPRGKSFPVEYGTWYYYEGWVGDQFGYLHNEFPFGIMKMRITGYETVGTEEIRGRMTTHYIVSHEPMMKLPQELEMQYFHLESATGMSPRDYFRKYVAAEIVENHPDLYNGFMELMEQRWYKDNKTHVWLTEDGWLLRIGYPYTFETYESHFRTFAEWDTYESFEYALTDISYEVTESGEWLEVQTPSAFSQLRPVIKMVDLYYGEEVEPIVIPETYENLAG